MRHKRPRNWGASSAGPVSLGLILLVFALGDISPWVYRIADQSVSSSAALILGRSLVYGIVSCCRHFNVETLVLVKNRPRLYSLLVPLVYIDLSPVGSAPQPYDWPFPVVNSLMLEYPRLEAHTTLFPSRRRQAIAQDAPSLPNKQSRHLCDISTFPAAMNLVFHICLNIPSYDLARLF